MTCENLSHRTKYKRRNAPPYAANDCPNMQKPGNDGNIYQRQRVGTGTKYRWIRKTRKTTDNSKDSIVDVARRHQLTTSGTKRQVAERIFRHYGRKLTTQDFRVIEPFLSDSFLRQEKQMQVGKRAQALIQQAEERRRKE